MTTVLKLVVRFVPNICLMCDFHIVGTPKDIGCEHICVAGRIGRQGKECLTREEVTTKRPDWCPLEEEGNNNYWSMAVETDGLSEFIDVKDEKPPYVNESEG